MILVVIDEEWLIQQLTPVSCQPRCKSRSESVQRLGTIPPLCARSDVLTVDAGTGFHKNLSGNLGHIHRGLRVPGIIQLSSNRAPVDATCASTELRRMSNNAFIGLPTYLKGLVEAKRARHMPWMNDARQHLEKGQSLCNRCHLTR